MTSVNSKGTDSVPCCRSSSQVFRRNRAIGYVSNNIPAVVRYLRSRNDTLITTCIGRSFQVYTANHFSLIHVSSLHPDEITALATNIFFTYTASAKCIYVWKAGKHVRHILRGHERDIHILMPFGRRHLIAIDEGNALRVWDVPSESVYLEILFDEKEFKITALAHPPTYINKILLGSQQGQLQLWNIKNNKCLFVFPAVHESQITCLTPAPALDVVAIGYQSGHISLLNLKFNEILFEFKQDWGAVTQISFRTDGQPIMATSSQNGHIAFWNLEERKIANQTQAHESDVTTTICFPNEPLMLTTSPDNSMKLWIFDLPDGAARMLRLREGHTAPPLCIRYHGCNGTSILSSGEDSALRVFSTISESLNKSMGKASYNRKSSRKKNRFTVDTLRMPPIIEFTAETTREKEWDNIAAIHAGIKQTTTWTFHKSRMGEHRLMPQNIQTRLNGHVEATCVALTHCGNFVIIGYSTGDVQRFNIQSGIFRACYGKPAHKASVRGVITDNLNQYVASGCNDGLLKFWPFKQASLKIADVHILTPKSILKFNDGIGLMRMHRESGMIAVVLINFVVHIIDADTKAQVRKFEGHTARINDAVFSPDSRWLLTAAMDSTIKVWDIPSSYMIDHFRVERPCVSLTMSPTGDFLATAHVGYLGIYLWANKTLFNQISLHSIDPYEPAPYVGLPASASVEYNLEDEMTNLSMDIDDEGIDVSVAREQINLQYETPKQLDEELITLSGLATSRWQNLLDLELIKKRNKPKAPPKVPKQAPFFLPTVAGLDLKFDLSVEAANQQTEETNSRILKTTSLSTLTQFGKLLFNRKDGNDEEHFARCVAHIKELGPSMIDYEIKSLHPLGGGSEQLLVIFLKMIDYMFKTNLDFELAQSYLSVFLRAHGLGLLEFPDVVDEMKRVQETQTRTWNRIEESLMFGMGVVSALRNFVH